MCAVWMWNVYVWATFMSLFFFNVIPKGNKCDDISPQLCKPNMALKICISLLFNAEYGTYNL